jgi:hypothetical protein
MGEEHRLIMFGNRICGGIFGCVLWRKWQENGEDCVVRSFIVSSLTKYYYDDQTRRDWQGMLHALFFFNIWKEETLTRIRYADTPWLNAVTNFNNFKKWNNLILKCASNFSLGTLYFVMHSHNTVHCKCCDSRWQGGHAMADHVPVCWNFEFNSFSLYTMLACAVHLTYA